MARRSIVELRSKMDNLLFSIEKLEITIRPDKFYEGYFEIEDENGAVVEGYVYSSSIRMSVINENFEGTNALIKYKFSSFGMVQGEALRGEFIIVSNAGEYIIPYSVMIGVTSIESSLGEIKNLFHFTNLAKTNWDEAVDVFNRPEFVDILKGNDAEFLSLYKGLTGRGNKNYNLEEFLIGINKKQPIEYSLDKNNIRLSDVVGKTSQHIRIDKSCWGYTGIAVKSEGSFIELKSNRIENRDFDGDVCDFEFFIDESKLHKGKNIGRITFKTLYDTFYADITMSKLDIPGREVNAGKKKNIYFLLVRHYIDYVTGKINREKWISITEELIDNKSLSYGSDTENSLYRAHLLLIQERYNEAKWILDRKISDTIEKEGTAIYCYYLYLTAIYNADEYYMREAADRIKNIYEREPENWRVAWVLMNISEEFKKNPARMYAFGVRQIKMGSYSPLIYVELIKLLNKMPTLLVHFDEEEIKLLRFASRHRLIEESLIGHIAYHGGRKREYDNGTYKILCNLYEANPSEDILFAICSQLVKGGMIGEKYFKWYELGVSKNFSITKLYEHYILSIDTSKECEIPREVLMYFSYQSGLPSAKNAYLYSYVVKNKDKIPGMYALYLGDIERFTVKQLYAGRINRDMAYLYSEILLKNMNTPDNLRQFAKLMLAHGISVEDTGIVNVVIVDERLKKELVCTVKNGMAYVPIFGTDYAIFLEDSIGNRFYKTKEYIIERYFVLGSLLPMVENHTDNMLLFNLYICDGQTKFSDITEESVERYAFLEEAGEVSDRFKATIRMPLLRYYQDNDSLVKMDMLLEKISYDDVAYKERDELLKFMLLRGMADKAYDFAIYYGLETVEPKILLHLGSMLVERDGFIEKAPVTAMLLSAFERGKYNEKSLEYLGKFYKGSIKVLRDIWKAASGFYTDTYHICEKLINRFLETRAYIGDEAMILREYVAGGAKPELVLKYITYFAEEYFINDKLTDDYIFREIARFYENEGKLPIVCMLAFLKHYAEEKEYIDDGIRQHIKRYVRILYKGRNIVMPFMKEFKDFSSDALALSDYVFVEYHGNPDSKVFVNYTIEKTEEESQGYIKEEMTNVYGGVFVKSFLIFFGEEVQYYITEEGNTSKVTESGTLSKNDVDGDTYSNRYSLVNDISIAVTLKDYDTALKLLEDYKYRLYLTDNLFKVQ